MSTIVMAVKSVKRGPIPDDGSMSTTLAVIGDTYKGSVAFTGAQNTKADVMVEEKDYPVFSFLVKGLKTVKYSLVDWTPETVVLVAGGTIGADGLREEPDAAAQIYESYQIITQTGYIFEFAKCLVEAVENAPIDKTQPARWDVQLTPLIPDNSAVKSVRHGKYVSPIVSAGAAAAVTAASYQLAGTATLFRGDTSVNLWTIISKPAGAADPTFDDATSLTATVSGLVNGVYKLQLSVTDVNDFTSVATVTLTVSGVA